MIYCVVIGSHHHTCSNTSSLWFQFYLHRLKCKLTSTWCRRNCDPFRIASLLWWIIFSCHRSHLEQTYCEWHLALVSWISKENKSYVDFHSFEAKTPADKLKAKQIFCLLLEKRKLEFERWKYCHCVSLRWRKFPESRSRGTNAQQLISPRSALEDFIINRRRRPIKKVQHGPFFWDMFIFH